MIAEFSMHLTDPVGNKEDVGRIVEVIKLSGLHYTLGPIGACLEGSWDQVMSVIGRCRLAIAPHHKRVIISIIVDDAAEQPNRLKEIATAMQLARSRMPHGDMEVEC